ncbi:hypothetical protein [Corynebacterium heidelbergense]|uniref:hypothetical protein n=1 Tax=Corynebacterium heidelbergense TaxID=2055947 RepID=UPI001403CC0A|nr:hypothetical protein [Corynebacterium heidelbergense]
MPAQPVRFYSAARPKPLTLFILTAVFTIPAVLVLFDDLSPGTIAMSAAFLLVSILLVF